MNCLSNGKPATLAGYRELAAQVFGEKSAATVLLDYKIEAFGATEEIFAPEAAAFEALVQFDLRTVEATAL